MKIILLLSAFLSFCSTHATSIASAKIANSQGMSVTCFSDSKTKIDITSAHEREDGISIIEGNISQGAQPLTWSKESVSFTFESLAEKDETNTTNVLSRILIENPYVGEQEELLQEFPLYLEFHILTSGTWPQGSTGFGEGQENYGFGVQCFFSGL